MSSLIPDEELRHHSTLNLAPMVDFLFLVLAVFVTLAVTRAALFDEEVNLVKVRGHEKDASMTAQNEFYTVNLSVTEDGKYKWITEANEFLMDSLSAIQQELYRQQELGLLPKEKEKTKVLLHIDQGAKWAPISEVIFSVRDAGFVIHPVYEPKKV
jgi:biopolymer transport protein ExbD